MTLLQIAKAAFSALNPAVPVVPCDNPEGTKDEAVAIDGRFWIHARARKNGSKVFIVTTAHHVPATSVQPEDADVEELRYTAYPQDAVETVAEAWARQTAREGVDHANEDLFAKELEADRKARKAL